MTARPRPSHIAPVVLVVGALLAAGCTTSRTSGNSASTFRGDQKLAAQTIEDLQSAASSRDDARICRDLLTRALASRLTRAGRDCASTVDEAVRDADSVDMTVLSVRVTGDRATARVRFETGKSDRTATLQLQREAGRWRVAGF